MAGYHLPDIAMYVVWLEVFQHSWTVPNYAVPWPTEPAFFNLLFFVAARISKLLGSDALATTLALQFLCYIAGSCGLFFAFRVFLKNARERLLAAALVLCSVPVPSLFVLPRAITGHGWPLPGIGYFVWTTSDGFYHGIAGSVLVTFGTAGALIALGLMGAYLRDGRWRWLAWASPVAFLVAYIHANEALLICLASAAAVLLRPPVPRWKALRDALPMWLSAAAGVLLLAIPAWHHPWLRYLSEHNRRDTIAVADLAIGIGLPALLCLALLAWRRSKTLATAADVLLVSWFLAALAATMLPLLPTPQHFLDGFHYVCGILLARLLYASLRDWKPAFRTAGVAGLAACSVLSLWAYASYCRQGYLDGARRTPQRLFSAVQPVEEIDLVRWFRRNADPDEVVLSPHGISAWVATAPIHAIGAHWNWGYGPEIWKSTEEFFAGRMDCGKAAAFLNEYQVRYIVTTEAGRVPDACLADAQLRAQFAGLAVYQRETPRSSGAISPLVAARR